MAEQTLIGTTSEVPVFFKGGDEDLFGILTVPPGPARGIGVMAVTGGGFIAAPNRNRLSVRLAATLAPLGYHVLRFDYHGIGESTGHIKQFALDQPFVEDLEAAVAVMRQAGLRRLVCVGGCFGTRTILSGAERIPELEGVVLMAAPVRDFRLGDNLSMRMARDKSVWRLARLALRRDTLRQLIAPSDHMDKVRKRHMAKRTITFKARMMFDRLVRPGRALDRDPNAVVSPHFARSFSRVVDRGVPILMLYGDSEGFYEEFLRVRNGSMSPVFERAGGALAVETLEGVLHGFTTIAVQDAAIAHTAAWLERTFRR